MAEVAKTAGNKNKMAMLSAKSTLVVYQYQKYSGAIGLRERFIPNEKVDDFVESVRF